MLSLCVLFSLFFSVIFNAVSSAHMFHIFHVVRTSCIHYFFTCHSVAFSSSLYTSLLPHISFVGTSLSSTTPAHSIKPPLLRQRALFTSPNRAGEASHTRGKYPEAMNVWTPQSLHQMAGWLHVALSLHETARVPQSGRCRSYTHCNIVHVAATGNIILTKWTLELISVKGLQEMHKM